MFTSEIVRSVLASTPDALIIIDSAGKILFANDQIANVFGHSSAEIVGSPIEILLPERFRQRHVDHRSDYTRNVRVRPMGMGLELFGVRKDGSEFPVEISLSPIQQGNEVMVAAAIRDVSDRKRVEQGLTQARRGADHANLAKSRFLATASHDLRQPLQTLALLNGALRRMVGDAECREILEQQDQAIDAMSRLLSTLLDISKLESGAIAIERADFEIAALFEELRRDFAGMAANKGLHLLFDSPQVQVHSDAALIGQVLRNLLSNAIKYTPKGSVEVRCEKQGEKLRIEVRDSGVGISADQLPFIFDEFFQVGVSPNSSRDGYGLGLSIVQRVAKLLDMPVTVSSVSGVGSVFAIELPISSQECAAADRSDKHASTAAAQFAGYRVLLVEDEPGVRNAMRVLLKIAGYSVVVAASASEALESLRSHDDFDLVVTDFHLENGRTGTEVIEAAREIFGRAFKAVLVTGDTSSAVRELQGDANLRITSKPINSDELLALIRALLAE